MTSGGERRESRDGQAGQVIGVEEEEAVEEAAWLLGAHGTGAGAGAGLGGEMHTLRMRQRAPSRAESRARFTSRGVTLSCQGEVRQSTHADE